MKKRIILPIILIVLGLVVIGYVLTRALFYAPDSEINLPSSVASSPDVPAEHPKELQIPSINVDAKVQEVGITKAGNMGVPNNYTDVGWYKYGTLPGQDGSAVIAGHVDNGLSLPGVFKNLNQVQKGDSVYVISQDGTKLRFVVTDISVYGYKDDTYDVFNRAGASWLRLITCTGEWLPAAKTDDHRLVVTARLAS
ncbi:MAG TPA: class F sortase [Candidatus Paceibacterota bacterium]|nr:class F sortase [Candidatus Paceibacterota bacterium]